jgi:hypothetical protein
MIYLNGIGPVPPRAYVQVARPGRTEDVGLLPYGDRRRVPALRREESALLVDRPPRLSAARE